MFVLHTYDLIDDAVQCDIPLNPEPAFDMYPCLDRENIKKLTRFGYKIQRVHKLHGTRWIWVSRISFDQAFLQKSLTT